MGTSLNKISFLKGNPEANCFVGRALTVTGNRQSVAATETSQVSQRKGSHLGDSGADLLGLE